MVSVSISLRSGNRPVYIPILKSGGNIGFLTNVPP